MNRLNEADYNALLEADPGELRGEGNSPIAMRVREDERVRNAAADILEQMNVYDVTISALVDAAVAKPSTERKVARRSISRVWGATLVSGSLAAAAIAAIIVLRSDSPIARPAATREPPLTATLNASSTRPFAVIPTDNPDIAIVWLFDKEVK
jgi:hypothetical protein